jgi:hypothetical protein
MKKALYEGMAKRGKNGGNEGTLNATGCIFVKKYWIENHIIVP